MRASSPSPRRSWTATLVALPLFSVPLAGQVERRFLPDAQLAPTIHADPREPKMGGTLIVVMEGASLFGTGLEGVANVGTSLPVMLLSGSGTDRSVALGLQGGAFGRFVMDNATRDLVSTDWMFAVPLFVWRGGNWYRFRYRHFSSHLGDEYIEQFEVERADYTRDSFTVMAFRRVNAEVGLYAGADVAFNWDPEDSKPVALQAGVELAETSTRRVAQPYGGIDVMLDQDSSWRPRVNMQVGFRLFPRKRRQMRLVYDLRFGPSALGEFHRVDETLMSLGLLLEL